MIESSSTRRKEEKQEGEIGGGTEREKRRNNNNNNNAIGLFGYCSVELYNGDIILNYSDITTRKRQQGLLQREEGKNLVVTAGLEQMGKLCTGESGATVTYCGVGSSTTAENSGQTDLQTPIQRVTITRAYQASNISNFETFWGTAEGNGNVNESGLFSASSGGVMFCRRVYGATVVKTSSNTMAVNWTWTWSSS